MKKIFFPVLLFIFLFLPNLVSADTVITGTISTNTTWSPANGVYIIDSSFSVASGTTLTIEPGTIIKAKTTWYGGPSIYGRLIAYGTSISPIYFTSISDDSVGGDTNGDGPSLGTAGAWQGLYFKSGSEGSFNYVNLSYAGVGGYGYGDYVGMENDGGVLDIKHSNIYNNYSIISNGAGGIMSTGFGIYNKSGILSVSDSITDNNVIGIRIESGTTTISNTIFKNNIDNIGYGGGYGIYALGSEPLTLLNNTFSNNKKTAYVNASKEFIHSGNKSQDQTNRGFEINGNISNDLVFHSGDLPFIIGSLTIEAGKTLTLEPGAILKMNDYYSSGNIAVYGKLIAKGTKDKKIYITSLKDDSIGGDTNGDGNNTTPAPKDWNAIFLENGSTANFDNVNVSYGGYNYNGEYLPGIAATVYNRGAEFSVNNSFIGHNYGVGIFQDAGSTTITNSELTGQQEGIWSRGGKITISQSSLHNNTDQAIYNQSGPTIDARHNWWGDFSGPYDISTTTPTGVGDKISGDILYIPFLTAPPGTEKIINPVIIIPGIMGSAYKNGKLVIDPILHTYNDLIATLVANGYEKGIDLFTFPYEWRDSNVITANLLKDKIKEVKVACSATTQPNINCNKVDIIAHSMGGLAAREYIQSGQYQNDVDQMIFLGVPHRGSAESYLTWEAGEFPLGFKNFFKKQFFISEALQNFYPNLFNYIRNRPISSVQELLPTFNYLKDKDTGILREYPNNYPRNIFLEYLNNNISDLLNSGVDITNIVGNSGNNTIKTIRVVSSSDSEKWEHGKPDGFEMGIGDGTVTTYGATLDASISNEEWNGVNHLRLPRETSARIFNILTNKIADPVIYLSLVEKIFSIQLQSPIDVVVTAPNGKRIGKNFKTGEEYNEIPLAFYSGYQTDNEYITIPNPLDGEYKIEIQGTDNGGEYGISTSYISNKQLITKETTGITKPNQITDLNVNIDNANPKNLTTEKEVTLDILINDINGSYELGWIKDKRIKNRLIRQVNKIIKYREKIDIIKKRFSNNLKRKKIIEKEEKKVDKIILKMIKKELQFFLKRKRINQQAYNLLKQDLEYLLNN